jgi:hypothetical protein
MLSAYRVVPACVKTGSTWSYLHPMRSDLHVSRLIVPSPGIFTLRHKPSMPSIEIPVMLGGSRAATRRGEELSRPSRERWL